MTVEQFEQWWAMETKYRAYLPMDQKTSRRKNHSYELMDHAKKLEKTQAYEVMDDKIAFCRKIMSHAHELMEQRIATENTHVYELTRADGSQNWQSRLRQN